MSLPYVPPPHALSVDDVWPAELAQRCVDRANDARALMDAEHVVSGPEAGEHKVVTVPIAVARIETPHHQSPARPWDERGGQHPTWPAKGFREAPWWSPFNYGGQVQVIFRLPIHAIVHGIEVCAELTTPTITATNENAAAPFPVETLSENEFAIILGDVNAVQDLKALTIVVHGKRRVIR